MDGLKFGVEFLDNRGMGADESRPGRPLFRRELKPLFFVSCTCNHKWYISRIAYTTQTRETTRKGCVRRGDAGWQGGDRDGRLSRYRACRRRAIGQGRGEAAS